MSSVEPSPLETRLKISHGEGIRQGLARVSMSLSDLEEILSEMHALRDQIPGPLIHERGPDSPRYGVEGFGYTDDLLGAMHWATTHLSQFNTPPPIVDGWVTLRISLRVPAQRS